MPAIVLLLAVSTCALDPHHWPLGPSICSDAPQRIGVVLVQRGPSSRVAPAMSSHAPGVSPPHGKPTLNQGPVTIAIRLRPGGDRPAKGANTMPVEMPTYADLGERLKNFPRGCPGSAKRHRWPRSRSNDGNARAGRPDRNHPFPDIPSAASTGRSTAGHRPEAENRELAG